MASQSAPPASTATVRRWRRYLAEEQAEAEVYRVLAQRRTGEEAQILQALADAEGRHAAHWERLLADYPGPGRPGTGSPVPSAPPSSA